jgi:WD40 repeat protein
MAVCSKDLHINLQFGLVDRCWCILVIWAMAGPVSGFGQGPAEKKPAPKDLYGDPLPEAAVARLGSIRFHHPMGLIDLAFSPDGKTILALGNEESKLTARLWDATTGKERSRFTLGDADPHSSVRSVCFSPDRKTVALNHENSVELLDPQTGKSIRTFGGEHAILSCAFSPDGKVLAAGSMEWKGDNPIRVWESATGRELAPFAGFGVSLHALTFSADGKRLYCSPPGGRYITDNKELHSAICIWDVPTRKKLAEIKCAKSQVAFAPNGDLVAFDDGGVRVVAVATGKTVCQIAAKSASLAFTPDSKALVVLDEERVLALWDAGTGKMIRRFSGHVGQDCRFGALSADGQRLALMDGHWHEGGSIRLWDVASGEEVRPFGSHEDVVVHLAFASDGKLLASASNDRTVRLWNPATGKELHRFTGHTAAVYAVAFAPDGKTLASASDDGTTRIWDVAGRQAARFEHPPGKARRPISGGTLAYSSDGKTVTTVGRNGMVASWHWIDKKETQRLVLEHECSTFPVLVPFPQSILTASGRGWRGGADGPEALYLWNLSTGKVLQSMPLRTAQDEFSQVACPSIAASPSGALLASSQKLETWAIRVSYSDPSLRLWERTSGKEVLQIKDTMAQALAFSPDGRLLAADDGGAKNLGRIGNSWFGSSVNLWDTWTGERQSKLPGHTATVHCITFSPDGKTLATGGADHTILVWKTPPRKEGRTSGDNPTDQQLRGWWTDLAGADAVAAHRAGAKLVLHPEPAMRLIRDNLKPAVPVDPKEVWSLIAELDSEKFDTRNKAYQRLEAMGDLAEPTLRKALEANPSLEVQKRLETLVEMATGLSEKYLQARRSLTILEQIGSTEARQLLDALARGAPAARVTVDARTCLERLASRAGP